MSYLFVIHPTYEFCIYSLAKSKLFHTGIFFEPTTHKKYYVSDNSKYVIAYDFEPKIIDNNYTYIEIKSVDNPSLKSTLTNICCGSFCLDSTAFIFITKFMTNHTIYLLDLNLGTTLTLRSFSSITVQVSMNDYTITFLELIGGNYFVTTLDLRTLNVLSSISVSGTLSIIDGALIIYEPDYTRILSISSMAEVMKIFLPYNNHHVNCLYGSYCIISMDSEYDPVFGNSLMMVRFDSISMKSNNICRYVSRQYLEKDLSLDVIKTYDDLIDAVVEHRV